MIIPEFARGDMRVVLDIFGIHPRRGDAQAVIRVIIFCYLSKWNEFCRLSKVRKKLFGWMEYSLASRHRH